MRFKLFASAVTCSLLTSCALFNPYISTATIEKREKSNPTYDLSNALRAKFESNAQQLAYWQSGSTAVIAGLLGLGAYKGVTGGGSHQIAALAAGSGVIYGTSTALYSPSKEQIYIAGAAALLCLDEQYSWFDSEAGAKLYLELLALDSTAEADFKVGFGEAYSIAVQQESSYKTNVLTVGTQVNSLVAGQQPTAELSYAHVSSAISTAFVSPSSEPKTDAPKTIFWKATSSTAKPVCDQACMQEREKRIKELRFALTNWINATNYRNARLTTDQCSVLGEDSLSITGVRQGTPEVLDVGSKTTYPILNTTGRLGAFVKSSKAAEQGAVTAKITTQNGLFFVEVEGVSATTVPVNVYVSDYGKGRATKGFQVTVKAP
ncbi:hypothetical protein [Pseudomonas sp. LB3P25]